MPTYLALYHYRYKCKVVYLQVVQNFSFRSYPQKHLKMKMTTRLLYHRLATYHQSQFPSCTRTTVLVLPSSTMHLLRNKSHKSKNRNRQSNSLSCTMKAHLEWKHRLSLNKRMRSVRQYKDCPKFHILATRQNNVRFQDTLQMTASHQ